MQKAFIETQFPIARLSAESYKERKAVFSQTLTGLSKWWGRKPLILVRALIIGSLMPASDDPEKDRDVFLRILTMDDDGAWNRCKGQITPIDLRNAASANLVSKYFGWAGFKRGMSEEEKEKATQVVLESLTRTQREELWNSRKRVIASREEFESKAYSERIRSCERPENIPGPQLHDWPIINQHLGTNADSLSELIAELGRRLYGNVPKIGDCFCGGGSVPFEAARVGAHSYGSDLSPVATLLSWAALNIIGMGGDGQSEQERVLSDIFDKAEEVFEDWGIERSAEGLKADAYLYCVEAKPPGVDYFIPLAPSWVISEKKRVVIIWKREGLSERLQPEVAYLTLDAFRAYKAGSDGTVTGNRIRDPFNPATTWSVESLRGVDGLRKWEIDEVQPRSTDVFQERLFCIRWLDQKGDRFYAAPTEFDLANEIKVDDLVKDRLEGWQRKGFLPSMPISNGYNTDQPKRERGWTHWHHLFAPRQLLLHGLIASLIPDEYPAGLIRLGNLADFNSKLTRFPSTQESINNTFSNQALNTVYNYPCRATETARGAFLLKVDHDRLSALENAKIIQADARDISEVCDIWITDPPYADAVNYHELGDFFLSWYNKRLGSIFPDWIPDSRSELAVRGDGCEFRRSMVEVYGNLARHMPDNGIQVVMFTHQNPAVWADLGMILWASGLRVTSAWTISTETEAAGIKKGNYVQGTVCLVLRKRATSEPGFLFDVYPAVEDEVLAQIGSMQALDAGDEPNFNDSDYQLAAYAAALKVLTQYSSLDGKNVAEEVFAVRSKNDKSDFEQVIERAITIACDALIPKGLNDSWRDLSLIERYYLRAVDIESRGERRKGMYEELARGFGVSEIKPLLKSDTANGTRVYTPSGFGTSLLAPIDGAVESAAALPRRGRASASGPHPFAASPLRHLLFAICETASADNDPNQGRQYLRDTFAQNYWGRRESMVRLLDWLAALGNSEDTADWAKDSEAARILAGRLRNDDA
jgi:putative DNA methylase